MKKISLSLLVLVCACFSTFAQLSTVNSTAAGAGSSTDVFTHNGYSLPQYSLGWYYDQGPNVTPTIPPYAYFSAYGGFKFFTATQVRMFIDMNGNVGIGTTSPNAKLSIVENTGSAIQLTNRNSNQTWGVAIDATAVDDKKFTIIDQTLATPRFTIDAAGNVGVGTTTPGNSLSFKSVLDDSGTSGLTWFSPDPLNYGIYKSAGSWTGPDYPRLTLNWTPGIVLNPGSGYSRSFVDIQGDGLRVTDGQLGVGTTAPVSLFQVDEGCTKASIGDASGSGLNYGTSYLGFNASRNGTSWYTNSDGGNNGGGNNGGGVIYSSIFGDMYFSIIPTTSSSSGLTLTDTLIKKNIALRIDHTDGAVYAKQIYVQTSGWPDFVFKKNYSLRPLSEVKSYIEQNQHLPDMPAASTVEKDGINLGEMNKALLKKVEELTLYLIEKDKEIKTQQEINKLQHQTNQSQEERLKAVEQQLLALKTNK